MESRSKFEAEVPVQLPPAIDPVHEHYPFCIVWSPIPVLSWILPFVGHVAVCDSQGRIYDFQGSYLIGQDRMLFGHPVKYWDVSRHYVPSFYSTELRSAAEKEESVKREVAAYDAALAAATTHFRRAEIYNFFTNNCHAFVASSMNEQQLKTRHMGTVGVAVGMMLHGRYISFSRFIEAHAPFILLLIFVVLVAVL
ncbi:hypothetical protein LSCM1_03435 [Leishmania martiniquensis]|uniref:Uncharacterized protein n=1 Tax=Leishmania martiniquensis TaxID=1580590 RepID=A0A836GWV1_9TRYP|nr:hypothetical protein LSCM1_03435 [Leishmania martiniquensis]